MKMIFFSSCIRWEGIFPRPWAHLGKGLGDTNLENATSYTKKISLLVLQNKHACCSHRVTVVRADGARYQPCPNASTQVDK